jgi:pimeloyl-ACP methyl ester carboxylesterase
VQDAKQYPKLEMPVLGLAPINYEGLKAALGPKASNVRMVKVDHSGHFFPEENPESHCKRTHRFFPGVVTAWASAWDYPLRRIENKGSGGIPLVGF